MLIKYPTGMQQAGFSMIEVLVTVVIVAIGLLGLSGMQAKTSVIEMESYQRAQAMSLLTDLEDRVRASRSDLTASFAAGTVVRIGPDGSIDPANSSACTGGGLTQQVCEWALLLKGASETDATGLRVGAMLGARACVKSVAPNEAGALAEVYLIVTWQGMIATTTLEGEANECAGTTYGTGLARAAVTRVMLPKLDS